VSDPKAPIEEEEEKIEEREEEVHTEESESDTELTEPPEEEIEEDTANLIKFINGIFQRDPEEAKSFVPVDITSVAKAVRAFRDGVLLR
jgi:hypothetical protein